MENLLRNPFRSLNTASRVVLGLSLVAIFIAGCKKEAECDGTTCITLSGRVGTDEYSAVDVPGATIVLSSVDSRSTAFFSPPEIPVMQVTSDASGYYSLQFLPTAEMQRRGHYRLLFYKPGFGDETFGLGDQILSMEPGQQYPKNIHLIRPGGRLRLKITGFPGPSAANSTYTIVSYAGGAGDYRSMAQPGLSIAGSPITGSANITEATCLTAANQYAHILIYKTKLGVSSQVRDSIYCPLGNEVVYAHAF